MFTLYDDVAGRLISGQSSSHLGDVFRWNLSQTSLQDTPARSPARA